MLLTPFGEIVIICDGKEVFYDAKQHKYNNRSLTTPVDTCYRISDLSAKESIICLVKNLDKSIKNTGGSGENYLDSEFINDNCILTIGVQDEHPSYDVGRLYNGLKINILKPVDDITFGIAWVNDYTGKDDIRTWLAADPTLDK